MELSWTLCSLQNITKLISVSSGPRFPPCKQSFKVQQAVSVYAVSRKMNQSWCLTLGCQGTGAERHALSPCPLLSFQKYRCIGCLILFY